MVPSEIGMLAALGLVLVLVGWALMAIGRRPAAPAPVVLRRLAELPDGDPWKEMGSRQGEPVTSRHSSRDHTE